MKQKFTFIFKSLLLICFVFETFSLKAQIVFQEDFDGVSGTTSGGAGTYAFPAGWSLFNVDELTPDANVAYVNTAWTRREDFENNTLDSCAFSTSWTSPVGTSNDWMFTPAISSLPSNCILKWNAVAYDASYADGYEVRIMTEAPTTENILTSTVLFTQPAENSSWTSRQISLDAYKGMTIYIAFRNISTNMFLLLIDDITVEVQVNTDVSLKSAGALSQYTMIPSQQVTPFILKDTIINNGLLNVTNVQLKVNIYDESLNQIYTASSNSVSSLAAGAKQYFTAGTWMPAKTGQYYFKFFPVISETDQMPLNDTLTDNVLVTDTTYSRDDNNAVGGLGIGAGTGGFMGQQFTIVNQTDLRSVSYYVTRGYTGEKTACAIFNMSAGLPDAIIATTDTALYVDDADAFLTLPISGGSITLAPGEYVFAVIEFDSTLSLGQSSAVYTSGTAWVSWPAQSWANVEYFGSNFAKNFIIRPNMYTCSEITADMSGIGATCLTCPDGSISLVPKDGVDFYNYLWSTAETTSDISGLLPGNYNVAVTDSMNCTTKFWYDVINTVGLDELNLSGFIVSPNPNNGHFTISSVSELTGNITVDIFNLIGEKVYNSTYKNATVVNDNVNLTIITPGMHIIRFSAANYTKFVKVVIE